MNISSLLNVVEEWITCLNVEIPDLEDREVVKCIMELCHCVPCLPLMWNTGVFNTFFNSSYPSPPKTSKRVILSQSRKITFNKCVHC